MYLWLNKFRRNSFMINIQTFEIKKLIEDVIILSKQKLNVFNIKIGYIDPKVKFI